MVEQKEKNSRTKRDALTGMLSRHDFESLITKTIKSASGQNVFHHLCIINLDRFKIINDTYGCAAGDELLKSVCNMLVEKIDGIDSMTRFGSDEFALILATESDDLGLVIAQEIQGHIDYLDFAWGGDDFKITASIGVTDIQPVRPDTNQIIKQANIACLMAKKKGRNRAYKYDEFDVEQKIAQKNVVMADEIKSALKNERLYLYAQKIVPLQEYAPPCFEILLRAKDAKGGLLMPNDFFPAAREYDLSVAIDRWVVSNTLMWLNQNPNVLQKIQTLSINLSGAAINDDMFVEFLLRKLKGSQPYSSKIKFEVTEAEALNSLQSAKGFMLKAKALGCTFSLDDFGTGLSSFAYLRHLPFDEVKIDGMFVTNMIDDQVNTAIVEGMNHIGHKMNLRTVAEYVETKEISDKLKEIGIDYIQGYFIGKPEPIDDIAFALEH
jgi:diguanylate cyclase (GGDEF)-like protein